MTIQHLVISGGGPSGLLTYGAASYLAKQSFWSLSDIKSIYGCSIGAYLGVIFSLGYEWDWLDDYFIKRPWEKVVFNSTVHLTDIYNQKGLINDTFFIESIKPLLSAKELSLDITLEEFYEFNHVELHVYTIDINAQQLEKIDISYKTHPTLSLVKALQMTMSVPIVFHPVCMEETKTCFVDGGFLNNFPLNDCIEQQNCAHDDILAFKNIWSNHRDIINERSSIMDFLLILMKKLISALSTENKQIEIKNTVHCTMDGLDSFDMWVEALSNKELRLKSVEKGYKEAEMFLGGLHSSL
jgi:predicted acylesterase/phospholipase RssA